MMVPRADAFRGRVLVRVLARITNAVRKLTHSHTPGTNRPALFSRVGEILLIWCVAHVCARCKKCGRERGSERKREKG